MLGGYRFSFHTVRHGLDFANFLQKSDYYQTKAVSKTLFLVQPKLFQVSKKTQDLLQFTLFVMDGPGFYNQYNPLQFPAFFQHRIFEIFMPLGAKWRHNL